MSDPRFPGWKREGEYLFRRRLHFPGRGVEPWAPPFSPQAIDAGDLVFYDTETTGLSGGAGTVIFLLGAGRCEGRDLVVEQLFLADFPGEPEFLLAVRDLLRPFQGFVSYNGKTFDSPLLKTRFLMNRMEFETGPQVDLLHHARRLWKNVFGDCSLKAMESSVLGFAREMDIAGEDIPLVWLEFLRTGRIGALPIVFDHNVMDITSLVRLYGTIGRILAGDLGDTPVDEKALGRWLLGREPRAGVSLLEKAFAMGNIDAGVDCSLHRKRFGEWGRAVEMWGTMVERSRSAFAAVELAKHHEHRARDPGKALEVVDLLLSWGLPLNERQRGEIRKRRERLQRKIARARDGARERNQA
jgi:uncharacterized protein YprB with RNaseH-like and TPR domain